VSVEFSYLDFLIDPLFNARAGNLLIPMGFVNLLHEPPTYWGNFRSFVETTIIPSTWREMGVGAHGGKDGVRYSAYVLNGFNASKFDDTGVRGGRQKANRALWEDIGVVGAVDYAFGMTSNGTAQVGLSAFYGGADQGMLETPDGESFSVTNQIYEAHVEFRKGGFKARALAAASRISNAGPLSEALFGEENGTVTRQVPENQVGWYVEGGYDVAPHLVRQARFTLTPWVRFEEYNLQNEVSTVTGLPANPALDGTILTVGLESKPHPNVVLKLDLVFPSRGSDDPVSDEIRLGAGFIY
jgi:hypothetical protein